MLGSKPYIRTCTNLSNVAIAFSFVSLAVVVGPSAPLVPLADFGPPFCEAIHPVSEALGGWGAFSSSLSLSLSLSGGGGGGGGAGRVGGGGEVDRFGGDLSRGYSTLVDPERRLALSLPSILIPPFALAA